jgi:glycosyltransferase involved in cell wall biosynthesis
VKRVVFASRWPFWQPANGAYARSQALVDFLRSRTELTALFVGAEAFDDPVATSAYPGVVCVPTRKIGPPAAKQWLREWFSKTPCDVLIADRLGGSFVASTVPTGVKTMLDTIDIASERAERLIAKGIEPPFLISRERERAVFGSFDFVLMIQEREMQSAIEMVGAHKVILAPHPAPLRKRAVRDHAARIGLVASRYAPNVHGLQWFLKEVWPKLHDPNVTLTVCGTVREGFEGVSVPRVEFLGRVPDLEPIYDELDILINPVLTGAGLKIKTVEALGTGIPLVTTSEGARGLESVVNHAFACADGSEEFASALNRLLTDRSEREKFSEAGYAFAERALSPEACFANLMREIDAPLSRTANGP